MYKLRILGVRIDGPIIVFCENEVVYRNTVSPESILNKRHHSIGYRRCLETVAANTIRVAKEGTINNLADLFTNVMSATRRDFLLSKFTY